jgi:hypothetical protein
MSTALTNTYIADTYVGVLHLDGTLISTIKTVYDGNGNTSALSLGLLNSGGAITGPFDVSGLLTASSLKYPISDGNPNTIISSDGNKTLSLKSLADIMDAEGYLLTDGVYYNPTVTVEAGIIRNLGSGAGSKGIKTFTSDGTFTIPTGVTSVKVTATGGGASGPHYAGNAGATVIAYLTVPLGATTTFYRVKVGTAGVASGSIASVGGGATQVQAVINGIDTALIVANGGSGIAASAATQVSYPSAASGSITADGLSYTGDSYILVPGGLSNIDTSGNTISGGEESVGASSIWGTGPAYGGGQSRHGQTSGSQNYNTSAGSGVVVFEW